MGEFLSEDDIAYIQQRHFDGTEVQKLADEFDVSLATVRRALRLDLAEDPEDDGDDMDQDEDGAGLLSFGVDDAFDDANDDDFDDEDDGED